MGRWNLYSKIHVIKEMTNDFHSLKKYPFHSLKKSLLLISEITGSEFKLTEPCNMKSKTMTKVCSWILFAWDVSYKHLFASQASQLSPQVVVFWIASSPNSSLELDKEPKCLPQDPGFLCKGKYLKVWCATQALNWIQPCNLFHNRMTQQDHLQQAMKANAKEWKRRSTKLLYWLYKLPHSTALGWLLIFQCWIPLQFPI